MKKVILLLLLFPLIQFACEESRNCPKVSRFFNITGLEVTALTKRFEGNNYSYRPLTDQDSAVFDDFFLEGLLQAEYYGANSKTAFPVFPQALARDLDPCPFAGHAGSEEKLAGVYLISLGKYNSNILPGDTIKDALLVNSVPVANYLAQNSQKIEFQKFIIKPSDKPDPKEYQSFKLVYKLTNGETYEATTPRFRLF